MRDAWSIWMATRLACCRGPRRSACGTVVEREWGAGLIRSWNEAGWITLSQRIGNKIARLVGAGADELIVADSTSINLFKVLSAAAAIGKHRSSGRSRIVSERTSFPTDLYIANAVARVHGLELTLADDGDVTRHLDERVAILLLTHVHYRSGRIHSMREITTAAHDAGALVVWDLSHSAGAMSIRLAEDAADFAVGCGYKYLNGGPGAPAFVWAHATHIAWMDREGWQSPLPGWLGHADPFGFTPDYQPAPGMLRFLCGTPPILSLAALECGVDTVLAVEGCGGLDALREKSIALTELFIALVESRCAGHDLALASPRNPRRARQPRVVRAPDRRLRDRASAHRARHHRRLSIARHLAFRLRAALHALR